jgi:hypothetical protein
MKKIKQFCNEILADYQKNSSKANPQLVCRIKEGKASEAFSCRYAGGELTIEAESPMAAVHGLSQIALGIASGHYAEFLGDRRPQFSLRPLWIGCDVDVGLTSRVGISIPTWMRQEINQHCEEWPCLDQFCRRVLALGYNSVLIGNRSGSPIAAPEDPFFDLEAVCCAFHDYGLKVILKPSTTITAGHNKLGRCALNPEYVTAVNQFLSDLLQKVPSVDFIFLEGNFLQKDCIQHPLAYDSTQKELAEEEVRMLESALHSTAVSLIYMIPTADEASAKQQTSWLSAFSDHVGPRTILAFSAVAGALYADHLPPHPFWETLRRSPDVSATTFLPIVNIGSIQQGEGLWPSLSLDLIEKYFSKCRRHHFAGVVCLVNQLPNIGGLLECSLWVAAQKLWTEQPASLLAETWFRARRPEMDFLTHSGALQHVRQLVVELSLLRSLHNEKQRDHISSEECRTIASSSLIRLKYLQIIFEKNESSNLKRSEKSTFHEYFTCFARDARRIVLHFLQRFNVTLLHQKDDDDQLEGFWTQFHGVSQNVRYAKPQFLDHPHKGSVGSSMEKIYKENRMF